MAMQKRQRRERKLKESKTVLTITTRASSVSVKSEGNKLSIYLQISYKTLITAVSDQYYLPTLLLLGREQNSCGPVQA